MLREALYKWIKNLVIMFSRCQKMFNLGAYATFLENLTLAMDSFVWIRIFVEITNITAVVYAIEFTINAGTEKNQKLHN